MSCKVSVIVLTYNSSFDKIRQTLYSAILQTIGDYEIIVADDGSTNNNKDELKAFFNKNCFFSYKLCLNEQNAGTIKNILSALNLAEGEYIKLISPGDFITTPQIIQTQYDYAKEKNADILFGKCITYNSKGIILNQNKPKLLDPYIDENKRRIKHNYLFTRDLIIGASIFYKKEILVEYLNKISPFAKYSEDSLINYYLTEHNNLYFIDEDVVYYETGEGISTSASEKWQKILSNETDQIFNFLYAKRKISPLIYTNYKLKNKYVKLLFSILFDLPNLLIKLKKKLFIKPKLIPLITDINLKLNLSR